MQAESTMFGPSRVPLGVAPAPRTVPAGRAGARPASPRQGHSVSRFLERMIHSLSQSPQAERARGTQSHDDDQQQYSAVEPDHAGPAGLPQHAAIPPASLPPFPAPPAAGRSPRFDQRAARPCPAVQHPSLTIYLIPTSSFPDPSAGSSHVTLRMRGTARRPVDGFGQASRHRLRCRPGPGRRYPGPGRQPSVPLAGLSRRAAWTATVIQRLYGYGETLSGRRAGALAAR